MSLPLKCMCGRTVYPRGNHGECSCGRLWVYESAKGMWADCQKGSALDQQARTPKDKDTDTHGDFESGAKSSGHKPHYHLVPFEIFLERLAARYSHGADRYGEGNWRQGLGDRQYVMDRANHTIEHLLRAVDGIRRGVKTDDDDLAAVIWGAIFLMGAQAELGKGEKSGTEIRK